MKYMVLILFGLILALPGFATIHTVTTSGFTFSPSTVNAVVGDTVNFVLGGSHNALEVDLASWNANDNTSNGGFGTPFGGGQVILTVAKTYYYVCEPHASMGMKGMIVVQAPTLGIMTGSVTPTSFCAGQSIQIPFTISGSFTPGNNFTAQLSDASGSFGSPVVLGTLNGTVAGTVSGTIPPGTAAGVGYRVRVISSSPSVTGTANGQNLIVSQPMSAVIAAGGPVAFCDGGSVLLSAPAGASSYAWQRNATPIGGAASSSLSATLPGDYTVTVTNGACQSNSSPFTVTVHPLPTASVTPAGSTTFCDGGQVVLNASTGAGWTHVWKRNGTPIPSAIQDAFSAQLSGSYTVTITTAASCTATSAPVVVTALSANPSTLTWTGAVNTDWNTIGNWDSPCAIPTAGDTVLIPQAGPSPSSIPAISLGVLNVNNGGQVTLNGDVDITGELNLQNGHLVLGSHTIRITSSGILVGGSAQSFLVTSGSGALRFDNLGAGGRTGSISFPIGNAPTSYTPVVLSNAGTADDFRARVQSQVLTGGSSGAPLTSNHVAAGWFIDEAVPGGSNATVTLQWNSSEETGGFARTSSFIARYDGTQWVPLQGPGSANGAGPFTRSVAGLTQFSPFAVGDLLSSLPVELSRFSARNSAREVLLEWTTTSEQHLHGFAVERRGAKDLEWTSIGFVLGWDISQGTGYQFLDTAPLMGRSTYRLRIIDEDGSSTVTAEVQVSSATVPSGPQLSIDAAQPLTRGSAAYVRVSSAQEGPIHVALYSGLGRKIDDLFTGTLNTGETISLNLATMLRFPGVFFIQAEMNGESRIQKVVVGR